MVEISFSPLFFFLLVEMCEKYAGKHFGYSEPENE